MLSVLRIGKQRKPARRSRKKKKKKRSNRLGEGGELGAPYERKGARRGKREREEGKEVLFVCRKKKRGDYCWPRP